MNLRGSITKTPLQNITLSLQQDLFLVLQDFLAEVDNSMLALDVDVYWQTLQNKNNPVQE